MPTLPIGPRLLNELRPSPIHSPPGTIAPSSGAVPIRVLSLFFFLLAAFFTSMGPAADPKAEPKEKEKGKPNRLAKESSPYLLQHAHNPVDWYPWGQEAFDKAKKEKKLVFLSIGYSAGHWRHVMERESFSNADAAKRLSDNFVCINGEREERPDVDDVYM